MNEQDLVNRFSYHLVDQEKGDKMNELRKKFLELAIEIDNSCEDSREKSLSITNLEEAMFWIIASIARK